jgi:hypothetical protein
MVTISDPTFNQCQFDDDRMTRTVGFRELDINGYDNYTLNFTCADTPPETGTGTGTGDGTGTGTDTDTDTDDGWSSGTDDGTGDGDD